MVNMEKGNNSKNHQKQQSLVIVDDKIEPLAVALEVFCFKQKLPKLKEKKEMEEKSLEKQESLEDYDITLESLEEYTDYTENRPLFETNQKAKRTNKK